MKFLQQASEKKETAGRLASGNVTGEDIKKTIAGDYGIIGQVRDTFKVINPFKKKSNKNVEAERKQKEGSAILDNFKTIPPEQLKAAAKANGMTTGEVADIVQKEGFNILSNPKFQNLAKSLGLEEKGRKQWKNLNASGYGKQTTSNGAKGFNSSKFLTDTTNDIIGNAWDSASPEQKKTVTDKVTDSLWAKTQEKLTENPILWVPFILLPAAIVLGLVWIFKQFTGGKKSSKKGKYNG